MPDADAPEITNTRRILAVSLEDEANHLSRVLKDLTNSAPEPTSTTLAGTTHDLPLKTAYYTATIPIWIDLIPPSGAADWAAAFLSPEAKEVLSVLGGLVLIFALPPSSSSEDQEKTRGLIREVGKVAGEGGLGGWAWDGVGLAVGVGDGDAEEWEDVCAGVGLEFVQLGGKDQAARNEFGEKTGIPRIREALEANDWAQLSDDLSDFGDFKDPDKAGGDEEDDGKDFDPESLDFGYDKADFEGLKAAIWSSGMPERDDEEGKAKDTETPGVDALLKGVGDGEEGGKSELDAEDVEKVEKMMRKLQAVREAGEGMGYEQRRRMAARAVEDVMKEL